MNKRSDTPPRPPAFATVPGTDYAALYAPEPIKPRITSTADTPRWGGTPARLRVQPGPAVPGAGLSVPRAIVPGGGAPASYPRKDDRHTAVMASPPTTFVTGGAEEEDDDALDTPDAAAPPRASADPDTPGDDPDPHQPAPDALELMPPGAACGSRRQDGWSAANQRRFLEALAEGHGVDVAARRVGLSATSAYAFRRTAKGAVFALGWRAAALVARDSIAETLLVRALEGTVDTIVRGETVITRHKYDNRLGLALLARLDRQAESAPDADAKAARLVAQEFDAYLDLVGRDQGAARAGLFLARRTGGAGAGAGGADDAAGADAHDLGPIYALAAADRLVRTGVATAAEVDIADLDPAARAGWSGEQWARAEAAGMVALAPPPPAPPPAGDDETALASQHSQHSAAEEDDDDHDDDDDYAEAGDVGRALPGFDPPVWRCAATGAWRTRFPPPAGFAGAVIGDYGDDDYARALTPAEAELMDAAQDLSRASLAASERQDRDRWFARVTTRIAALTVQLAASADPGDGSGAEPGLDPGTGLHASR
ncbi:hypothetical protein [Sphingomonas sp. STIS6.2]|uniref:hypothetical protein n=1 Tax=Sphingomonas sp. STIS6.2 TaxID=1379700 RepID=UPI000D143EFA|nr:hypothetical protein [Sphingomonas sp. STIS6.2]